MNSMTVAVACLLLSGTVAAETVNRYALAHTRQRNVDMVVVKVGERFFSGSQKQQAIWYTDMEACARSVKLAGKVVLVSATQGRFRYYGPKSHHPFLKTIDMAWVNARLNKEITCVS